MAQFFPRMVVYCDNQGWQHKQFLGMGEFTLNFGNYDVKITVPADHVVASTGVLQNPKEVLSAEELNRYTQAKSSNEPIVIVTQEEAEKKEKSKEKTKTKTWHFKAENVRDFAFATSRKFIWDAQAVEIGTNKPMAMSFYPKEGNPLWGQFSTRVVAHTLRSYSKYTVDYPYPVAISVHTKWMGMEYPMICFNGGRPEKDGTYDQGTRDGMISVIIHEVGHNFFPMIINSDERQWTWMDEGLNTFVQYLAEKEYDRNYPTRRGPARNIVDYMRGDKSKMSPIMTNSESIYAFGNNAYGKPATALNILRETVMGRELFDYAFKEYCRRWAFRHPTPDDFFRTMEDASAVDLDWFWRGWFYGTDHCDMNLKDVKTFRLNTHNPEIEKALEREKKADQPADISLERDIAEKLPLEVDQDPDMRDFYTSYDPYRVTALDRVEYDEYINKLNDKEKELLSKKMLYYQVTIENKGGLIMPLIFELEFKDGNKRRIQIPAEIWKRSEQEVTKVFACEKEVTSILLDPQLETADVDLSNNAWPPRVVPTRFELFKESQGRSRENQMQRAKREAELLRK
jgi:aminopeptidase N